MNKIYTAQLIHQCWINNKSHHNCDIAVIMIKAKNAEEAYNKAEKIAKEKEHEYKNNRNQTVKWKYMGMPRLQKLHEYPLTDGAEIFYEMKEIKTKKELKSMIFDRDFLIASAENF